MDRLTRSARTGFATTLHVVRGCISRRGVVQEDDRSNYSSEALDWNDVENLNDYQNFRGYDYPTLALKTNKTPQQQPSTAIVTTNRLLRFRGLLTGLKRWLKTKVAKPQR